MGVWLGRIKKQTPQRHMFRRDGITVSKFHWLHTPHSRSIENGGHGLGSTHVGWRPSTSHGRRGWWRIMKQCCGRPTDFISTKPISSLATPQISEGRWKQRIIRSHINAPKPDLDERWMIGVAWKGSKAVSRNVRLRDGMSPRRRRLHFSRLPACDPTSSQCLVSIHRLLNYSRLTLHRFRAICLHHWGDYSRERE
jgi:hypothetical protein